MTFLPLSSAGIRSGLQMFETMISANISVSNLLSWVSFCWCHFIHLCGLKLGVLCCCNQRRSKDSPNAFPWGYLAWDFSREKRTFEHCLVVCLQRQAHSKKDSEFRLGKTSLPSSLQFLKHAHPHLRLRAAQLYWQVIFFWKKSRGKKLVWYGLTAQRILSFIHWQIEKKKKTMPVCFKGFAPGKQCETTGSLWNCI